jgi:HEPN domain-containing protein
MTPMTREWLNKAEGDYGVVSLLLRSRKRWRFDAICFDAQQCAEKYLKARLVEAGIVFPKTHDLEALLRLALPIEPAWIAFWPDIKLLSIWSVQPRYPGASPSAVEARQAVKAVRRYRAAARRPFGLPP